MIGPRGFAASPRHPPGNRGGWLKLLNRLKFSLSPTVLHNSPCLSAMMVGDGRASRDSLQPTVVLKNGDQPAGRCLVSNRAWSKLINVRKRDYVFLPLPHPMKQALRLYQVGACLTCLKQT